MIAAPSVAPCPCLPRCPVVVGNAISNQRPRDGHPRYEERPGESRPTARIDRQNGGEQLTLPTPVDRPREESTMPALAIAATPSIAPEGADSPGDITVSVTFNPTDPYGMIELNTSLDLDEEALLDALDDLLKHVIVYRGAYRIEMLADRGTRNEVRR